MLKSFKLINYQSHKDSTLEFHPGLNAIVGASDSGKSAIMRGIFATIFNSNCGIPEVSRWIKTPKKAIKKGEEMRLVLVNEKHQIERFRNSQNGYVVDGENMEAIGASVPEKVTKALGITDVNIHQQDDPYFLLSASNGEAGKYINKMVNLQEIDQFTSEMKSELTRITAQVEENAVETKKLTYELASLSWVDEAEIALEEIEEIEKNLSAMVNSHIAISSSIESYSEAKAIVEKTGQKIESITHLIKEIRAIDARASKLAIEYNKVTKSLKDYETAKKEMVDPKSLAKAESLLQEIRAIEANMPSKQEVERLSDSIAAYNEAKAIASKDLSGAVAAIAAVRNLDKRIANLKDQRALLASQCRAFYDAKSDFTVISDQISEIRYKIEALKPLLCPTCGQMRNHEH